MINISKPCIGKEEERALIKVLRSGSISQGKIVEEFEKQFAKYIGTKYAIATSNGTTALHLSLLSLDIDKEDEVITTPFTFIATANSILYTGAKPVFVDIDKDTFNINPKLIEEKITKKTKAIIPVHLFGLPCNMEEIIKIAKKYSLYVIEDACQAHGAELKRKKMGSIGTLGCFSFYPTKNMTTGEGGMITTNNKKIAEKIKMLRNHGMKKRYHNELLGYNFRMTDLAAAIGIEQLKKLDKLNKNRIKNANFLTKRLSKIKGVITPSYPENYKHVFNQYTIKITKDYYLTRKKLIEKLNNNNIGYSIYYPIPLHKQKVYKSLECKDYLLVSEELPKQVLSLPIHPMIKKQDLEKIIFCISQK